MPRPGNEVIVFDAFDSEALNFYANSPTQQNQRNKRQQARKACNHCKRLHAKCSNERPCKRCESNGLAETCTDSPRKQRMSRPTTPNSGNGSNKVNIEEFKPRKEFSMFSDPMSSNYGAHDMVLTHLDNFAKESYEGKRSFSSPVSSPLIVPRVDDDSSSDSYEVSKPIYLKSSDLRDEPIHKHKHSASNLYNLKNPKITFATEPLHHTHSRFQHPSYPTDDMEPRSKWPETLSKDIPNHWKPYIGAADLPSPFSEPSASPVISENISSPFSVQSV